MFVACSFSHDDCDDTCRDMAAGCAVEVLLQLEAHIHQDVDGHEGLPGMLDVLRPQPLSHQLVPLLPVHMPLSAQQAGNRRQCWSSRGSEPAAVSVQKGRQCQDHGGNGIVANKAGGVSIQVSSVSLTV